MWKSRTLFGYMIGLYLHVPFCNGKCPYCDFYSLRGSKTQMDQYVKALCDKMKRWAEGRSRPAVKTVYFGGGTPNLLGAARLSALLGQAEASFGLAAAAEVTLEVNPSRLTDRAFFSTLREAGFNRLSMGMQSANEDELRLLGRKHTAEDVKRAVREARAAGFSNISLDMMLGLPGGSCEKLKHSVAFAAELGVEHISAYILKVEPGTPFAAGGVQLPEDDETADQYLFCVEELAKRGYAQYEISNFARPGFESRHNLVYWHEEEYLGLGPSAHSFLDGQRFFYPRSLEKFLTGDPPIPDGKGGNFQEYAMLNLRLTEGLRRDRCVERFGRQGEIAFARALENIKKCPPGLIRTDGETISFTPEGFLVSNALILALLEGADH